MQDAPGRQQTMGLTTCHRVQQTPPTRPVSTLAVLRGRSDLNAAWPAWANAAQELLGASCEHHRQSGWTGRSIDPTKAPASSTITYSSPKRLAWKTCVFVSCGAALVRMMGSKNTVDHCTWPYLGMPRLTRIAPPEDALHLQGLQGPPSGKRRTLRGCMPGRRGASPWWPPESGESINGEIRATVEVTRFTYYVDIFLHIIYFAEHVAVHIYTIIIYIRCF